MADYGHKWTDKRLEIMEKRIARIYSETVDDAKKRLGEILKTFEKEDKEKAALVEAGKMKRRNYIAWRQETLGKAKHLKDMIGVLSEDFTNADKIAMRIVSGEALDVYALNANFAAYDIEQNMKMNLSWTLYDKSTVERLIKDTPDLLPLPSVDIPVDMQWNRQHITEAITKAFCWEIRSPRLPNGCKVWRTWAIMPPLDLQGRLPRRQNAPGEPTHTSGPKKWVSN